MKKQTASCSASTTTTAIFFAQNFTKIHLGDCRLPSMRGLLGPIPPKPLRLPQPGQTEGRAIFHSA
jgi:hypothetical protein